MDYVRGRDDDVSGDLPRIPPLRNIVRARYAWSERFEAMMEGIFVAKQDEVSDFELPTDEYTLLNAELTVKGARQLGRDVDLFVKGTNLTDEEARVHTSLLKDLAPLRGRAFLLGVQARF
jgi:iron complex outermembrane recepter protein